MKDTLRSVGEGLSSQVKRAARQSAVEERSSLEKRVQRPLAVVEAWSWATGTKAMRRGERSQVWARRSP
jgi:hypothetical protein